MLPILVPGFSLKIYFCRQSLLNKLPKRNMLEAIRCRFSLKNFLKKLWLDQNLAITTWKARIKKIEPYMLCLENQKNITKILHEKNVMHNKIVWKPIKSSISDLLIARERTRLTKNDKFVKTTSILAICKGKKTDKLLFQSFYWGYTERNFKIK